MIISFFILFAVIAYFLAARRARHVVGGKLRRLHSQPAYHGLLGVAVWLMPAVLVLGLLKGWPNGVINPLVEVLASIGTGTLTLALVLRFLAREWRARPLVEAFLQMITMVCSAVSVLSTLAIMLALIFEAIRFFAFVSPVEFFFGLHWSPQIALRPDQVGSSGAFGAIPVFLGTFLITMIALVVAVPVGMMSAIFLSDYAAPSVRSFVKPAIEILAGIPSVVYGFFAVLYVGPLFHRLGFELGFNISAESALAAGLVIGIMIIPFISSVSEDVMNAVPRALRDASLAIGATKSETICRVVIPAALPGIAGGVLLAASRAIGETMIVVMAAGLAANLTLNPVAAQTTVTVQIVTLLTGDQEFDSPKTLAAFALGLTLFSVTLGLNIVAGRIVRRYQERYE